MAVEFSGNKVLNWISNHTISFTLIYSLLYIVLYIILFLIGNVAFSSFNNSIHIIVILILVSFIIIYLLFIPYFLKIPPDIKNFKDFLNNSGLNRIGYSNIVVISVVGFLSFYYGLNWGITWLVTFNTEYAPKIDFTVLWINNAVYLDGSIIAGFFEELVFRGILLSTLLKLKYNSHKAIIYQAIAFSGIHLFNVFFGEGLTAVLALPYRFLIGIFFGYLFIKSNSIWPCIIIHYCIDAFLILFLWIPGITDISFELMSNSAQSIRLMQFFLNSFIGFVIPPLVFIFYLSKVKNP